MSSPLHLHHLDTDGDPLRDRILGFGRTGVVVQRDGMALKLPLEYSTTGLSKAEVEYFDICAEISQEGIDHEKDVYRRLDQNDGIVSYLDLSGIGIQMALMTKGNLHDYLAKHRPDKYTQLTWFREMAHTLAHIHDMRVLVAEIASRNFLLAADLSVKFSDFSESTILPLGTDMQMADDAGYSIYTDIGELGAVMYEVITGMPWKFDLYKGQPCGQECEATWPRKEDLPCVQDIWLGFILDKCWTKGAYQNANELSEALNSVVLEEATEKVQAKYEVTLTVPLQTIRC